MMTRFAFLILTFGIHNLAFAEICTQIADDQERLACFDKTRACATILSDSERLDCFDSAWSGSDMSEVRVGDGNVSRDVPAGPALPIDQSTQRAIEPGDKNIEAIIVEVTTNARKIDYLHLDNGQVWRENEDSHVRFMAGQKVNIQAGIFGSTNLTMEGTDKIVKVKRVN